MAWVAGVGYPIVYFSWSPTDQVYFTYNPDTLGITPRNVTAFLSAPEYLWAMLVVSFAAYGSSTPVYVILVMQVHDVWVAQIAACNVAGTTGGFFALPYFFFE